MAKPNFYLHIGAPKTGTTLLQKHFSDLQPDLKKAGLLYPNSILRGFGHHDLAFMLNGGFPDWAKPIDCTLEGICSSLFDEIFKYEGDVLISSENFYLFSCYKQLHSLLLDFKVGEKYELKIICYIRRQDEAVISWYNQRVKAQGYTGSLSDSLEDNFHIWNYGTELTRWSELFGKDKLTVILYEENWKSGAGLLESFCSILPTTVSNLLLTTNTQNNPKKVSNNSLNRDLLEFQRLINQQSSLSTIEKRQYHHELMSLSREKSHLFCDAPLATPIKCQEILELYKVDNINLGNNFFNVNNTPFEALSHSEDNFVEYHGLNNKQIKQISRLLSIDLSLHTF